MSAAIVQDRLCRATGGRVQVIDAEASPDFDSSEGGRWITWCATHETFCQHETRALAITWSADPTVWCGECGS